MGKFSEAEVKAFVVKIATYRSIEANTTVEKVMKDFIDKDIITYLEDNYELFLTQGYSWIMEELKEYFGL